MQCYLHWLIAAINYINVHILLFDTNNNFLITLHVAYLKYRTYLLLISHATRIYLHY